VAARHGEHLRACLRALARAVPAELAWEVVLLLNRADPDVAAVAGEFSGLRVAATAVDLGLAGGLNRARSLASGELLVVLHDDTEVEPGWLEGLLAAAAAHPEAGAVGSWVLNMDGTSQHLGAVLWRDGNARLNQPGDRGAVFAVDYTGSSSMMVRAATWDAVGGASEEFFPAVYVDVDLALKIWESGQAVLVTQASRLRHRRSASTTPAYREFLFERHRLLFTAKWRDRLERQEPADTSPAAIERALDRAAARWSAARTAQAPRREPPALDIAAQDRRHLELACDLQRDWAAALEQRWRNALDELEAAPAALARSLEENDSLLRQCAAADAEAARLRSELIVLRAERDTLRERLETLAALQGLAWWRLYRRLLPLLRGLRRFSRPRGANRME
jgi:GT2 family glycosyltransferase